MVPTHLRVVCLVHIACNVVLALVAPFHETGVWRFVVPAIGMLVVALFVLFMRRMAWTWSYVFWACCAFVLINLACFPTPEFTGSWTPVLRVLAVVEALVSGVILWSMLRRPATRGWFMAERPALS
jgi:hypothetical protein